jgi:hypothetical protein
MTSMKMWFGNRKHMQWIQCPEAGANYTSEGTAATARFLDGGAFHRQTFNAAKTWSLSWALTSRDNVRAITDYVDGVHGDGPIYWSDPFVMDRNIAPQSLATPALAGYDAVSLMYSAEPELVATSANSLGYPAESAVYSTVTNLQERPFYFPIPPGYTAWVGVHGSVDGGSSGIQVNKAFGPSTDTGTSIIPDVLSVLDETRVNYSVDHLPGFVDGIELSLTVAAGESVTLSGIIVQVLPTGVLPEPGGFISGQGASGCVFNGWPEKEMYSAVMDYVGLRADFIETEQWA